MITKPPKIIKRIIKAVSQRQSVLVIGEWQEELIKGLKENQNTLTIKTFIENLEDNSFTRIIIEYSDLKSDFFIQARRLLLPTGMLIISANEEENIFDKIGKLFKRKDTYIKEENFIRVKPKVVQDLIHDNGFLIDGYYGYPGGHLLMMAQIQNKEVTTLFASDKQETIVNRM